MRKLIPTLLALPLLFPSAAYPLGLGDIRLHSALNQRFSGEIDLLSVRPEEAESIDVSLGSYETFARLGIDRVAALNHLEFEVVQRPNGSYYVQVSSERAIREPFLDFLIEVNWSSGRLLREYTVLLDPPEMMKEGAPAVAAPSTAPAVESPNVSAPQSAGSPSGSPRQNPPETASASGPDSERKAADSGGTPAPAPVAATSQIRTHHVVKGETLSGITRRLRPGSGTEAQVMMALLKANPEAFYDNNINRLKAGAVLRLDPALIGEMSRAEAAREVARQARAWQDYKQKAAQQAKGRPSTEPSREPGKAVASAEESRLKLVAPEEGGPVEKGRSASSAPGTTGPADLQQELALALEAAEAHRQQNAELQNRMKELEEQLTDMQRLLTLKNDDLAALQRQLKGEAAAGEPLPSELARQEADQATGDEGADTASEPAVTANPQVAEGADGPAEAADRTATGEGMEVQEAAAPEAAAPAPGAEGAPESAKPAEAAEPVKPAAESAVSKPAPAAKPVRPAVMPPPQPPKSMVDQALDDLTGMIGDIARDPILAMVIGGGTIFILFVLYLIIRRRKQGGGFQESILTAGDTSSLLRAKQAEGEASEEQSFFSDFAVSGMGDIQADDSEVDPLTEAGLYMDFGRYQQAEELLKEAARHNPDSAEVKATLLEVYYKTENREAFEPLAVESQTLLTRAGLWDKVAAMGHELAPDNPVFGNASPAAGGVGTAAAATAAVGGAEVLDIGLDLDALGDDSDSADNAAAAPASDDFTVDLGLDFSDLDDNGDSQGADVSADDGQFADLDFGFDEDATPATEADSGGGDESELDFDLGGLDTDSGSDEPASSPDDSAGEVLEFGGFDMEETAEPEGLPAESAADEEFGFGDLELGDTEDEGAAADFDLGGLELGSDAEAGSDAGLEAEGDLDMGGLDIGGADEPASADSDDLGNFDFGELDLDQEGDDGSSSGDGDLGGAEEFGGLELGEDTGADDLAGFDLGGTGGGDDFGDDDDLFGELDEIGTKLDLAKAYVDMGDADGARSILEEVLQDGDDAQKGQAQELMKQIA